MAYSKTVWNNNTPPDISAENLNKMEQGIYDAQFPDNGSTGQILSKTNDGVGWVDAPTSAEWGNITGQLSEQTDLYSELESKITLPSGGTTGQVLTKTASGQAWDDVDGLPSGGTAGQVLTKNSSTDGDASWQNASGGGNVDTVNGISPDANKNVQTATDLTEAAYEALPSTKESDNVDYYLTDADSTVATAEDIPYDNTDSGMTATNVQGALDELTNGLTDVNIASVRRIAVTFTTGATGNIATGVINDGTQYIVAPFASGANVFLRAWVSSVNGVWYLTAVDPNTGATINNTQLAVRYLLVTLKSAT